MTQRIYYTDSYCTQFDAAVLEVKNGAKTAVYLDRTAFYPTSGGQQHDLGELGGLRVVDVVDEGEHIAHVVEGAIAAGRVSGVIDWSRRYDHMQQHTGQHVLSALCADSLGARTLSVHFGAETSTLDIDAASLSAGALQEIERRANEVAWENRQVTVAFESAETVEGLRKVSERTGDLRIVSIEGLDRSACGGTHVRGTSEIAPVLLRRSERAKKALRIEFVCGGRALARAGRDFAALTRLAHGVSASVDDVVAVVESQSAALREAEAGRRKLAEAMAQYRARELYAAQPQDSLGIRRVVERGVQLEDVRSLALAFAALPRAVYVATSTTPPAILVAASDDAGVNAGDVVKGAVTAHGGRGGGSPRLAQGTVPTVDALENVIRAIAS